MMIKTVGTKIIMTGSRIVPSSIGRAGSGDHRRELLRQLRPDP
jgi:hypothetical protein